MAFVPGELSLDKCIPRGITLQHGHVGVYDESRENFNYIGVVIPVGRMMPEQMKEIAALSNKYGRGDIRLTAWQNLIIPGIKDEDVETVKKRLST